MKPKMKHLMSELNPIRYQWRAIGEQLELYDDGVLQSIEYNASYNDTMRLAEVFQHWIYRQTTEVLWRVILAVISDPPIDDKRRFKDLKKFLSRPDIQQAYDGESVNDIATVCMHVHVYLYVLARLKHWFSFSQLYFVYALIYSYEI